MWPKPHPSVICVEFLGQSSQLMTDRLATHLATQRLRYRYGNTSGVVVPERTGTPFWLTFWGRNGVPVVIRPPRRNAIAAAFQQMFAVKI